MSTSEFKLPHPAASHEVVFKKKAVLCSHQRCLSLSFPKQPLNLGVFEVRSCLQVEGRREVAAEKIYIDLLAYALRLYWRQMSGPVSYADSNVDVA